MANGLFNCNGVDRLGGENGEENSGVPWVSYRVVIRHGGLWKGAYSGYQDELGRRIVELREEECLPYFKIAGRLREEGWKASRGGELCQKKVFSVYQKRKRRDERLSGPVDLRIEAIQFWAPPVLSGF